jgi:hypothetical protein
MNIMVIAEANMLAQDYRIGFQQITMPLLARAARGKPNLRRVAFSGRISYIWSVHFGYVKKCARKSFSERCIRCGHTETAP